jgi:hypothetical protein
MFSFVCSVRNDADSLAGAALAQMNLRILPVYYDSNTALATVLVPGKKQEFLNRE